MKKITMPYDEYNAELNLERRRGFEDAIRLVAKMQKIPEDYRFKFLQDELDADAFKIAEKLGVPIPKNECPF
jgi:hypothetical protein